MRLLLAAIAVAAAACAASAPPAPSALTARKRALASSASASASASASSAVATSEARSAPATDAASRREAVLDAWAHWANSDVDAARATLRAVDLGPTSGEGVGALRGFVARGAKEHALSITGSPNDGAVFFDPASGAPQSFRVGVSLTPGQPALVAPYFVALPEVLDASAGTAVSLPGPVVAAHPDGTRVYVLDAAAAKSTGAARCALVEWSLVTGAALRELPTPPQPDAIGCDPYGYRGAVITANGAWLTTRLGRISLRGGGVVKLPGATKEGYQPTVSPDGRALVRVVPAPHSDPAATANVNRLAATDLDTGLTRYSRDRLSFLSNSDPLSTLADPPGICVFDYGVYAFAWPSLEEIRGEDGDARVDLRTGCRDRGARLASLPTASKAVAQLCVRGGFVLPRALCE